MTTQSSIRRMNGSDPPVISSAFAAIGWDKPATLFERYLSEQGEGQRLAFVAERLGTFAGYVTLLWRSEYPPFTDGGVPEISDLNVVPDHRGRGVGNLLLDSAETAAAIRCRTVGIGVGLTSDYGAAQRLYVRRGYVPDGRGIMHRNRPVELGANITVDHGAVLMLTMDVSEPVESELIR